MDISKLIEWIVNLTVQFGSLAGVAAFIASLVNVFKVAGLPDGSAPKVASALSLVGFIALVVLHVFAPQVDIAVLDQQAANIAVVILYVLGLVVAMGLPGLFHNFLKNSNVPLIGKSYSRDEEL